MGWMQNLKTFFKKFPILGELLSQVWMRIKGVRSLRYDFLLSYDQFDTLKAQVNKIDKELKLASNKYNCDMNYIIEDVNTLSNTIENLSTNSLPENKTNSVNYLKNNVNTYSDMYSTMAVDGKSKDELIKYVMGFFDNDNDLDLKKNYLKVHIKRYMETLNLIGKGDPGMELLEIGAYDFFMILLKKFTSFNISANVYAEYLSKNTISLNNKACGDFIEYETIGCNIEKEIFPYKDCSFDVVLLCEVLEHLAQDPMFAISEINRILKNDGKIIVTTPNITRLAAVEKVLKGYSPYFYASFLTNSSTDRHNREYCPSEVKLMLEKGGFKVSALQTKFIWDNINLDIYKLLEKLGMPTELRGDNIYAVGIKKQAVIKRYPPEFYDHAEGIKRK